VVTHRKRRSTLPLEGEPSFRRPLSSEPSSGSERVDVRPAVPNVIPECLASNMARAFGTMGNGGTDGAIYFTVVFRGVGRGKAKAADRCTVSTHPAMKV
jgi:hypothetical protein